MIETVKTYTGDTRWVQNSAGVRELRCRVREYTIWSCTKCNLYFWTLEKAKEHKHEMPRVRRVDTD